MQNKDITDVRTSIEDTLARRIYDESGDYVDDFELDIREHLLRNKQVSMQLAQLRRW